MVLGARSLKERAAALLPELGAALRLLLAGGEGCPVCGRASASGQLCFSCLSSWAELARGFVICDCCGRFLKEGPAPALCGDCRAERPPFVRARAVAPYAGGVRHTVSLFKFSGKTSLAQPLGQLMAALVKESLPWRALGAVVPVPLHPSREKERSFNQALLLGDVLGRLLGLPVVAGALVRRLATPSQVGLGRKARFANVKGAFAAGGEAPLVAGRKVLLVDDVYTTGATAGECTRVLLDVGAEEVYVVTLAAWAEGLAGE